MIIWDILDYGFFAQSLYEYYQCSSTDNAINLGLDAIGLFPGIPALGTLRRIDDAVDVTKKADTLQPGPFAKESIPAHRGKPTAAEQRQVNELMEKNGCHTCGTKNPGTKSGNAVADHQPAQALGEPKEFFPHCINCARRQGGQVRQEKLKRGN
ncbi:hypothetical protein Q9L42_010545 [Methylomarinum sp. Ch1-1]|uniref:HNH endonuclease n=1 Tax=Methylomarinum roseum TaxID=3067653 RepID=A0AAU7NPD6_9GAMM|nr:hypothetical protein [Methylomarinum sp. Ch1-1]MDP4521305.1 hypothetical protein [Methylomarinum sp. Ch1-1]